MLNCVDSNVLVSLNQSEVLHQADLDRPLSFFPCPSCYARAELFNRILSLRKSRHTTVPLSPARGDIEPSPVSTKLLNLYLSYLPPDIEPSPVRPYKFLSIITDLGKKASNSHCSIQRNNKVILFSLFSCL